MLRNEFNAWLQKGSVFHCFKSSHPAKNCVERPKCGIPNCKKTHVTLLPDRKMTGFTPNALPFRFYISPAPAAMLEAAGASVPAAAAASMSAVANPII